MGRVETEKFSSSSWQALCGLLDDPSPLVRAAVVEALKNQGAEGVEALRHWSKSEELDDSSREAARDILDELVGPDVIGDFVDFIHRQEYELETGVWMLNRILQPKLDIGALCLELDAIARRCQDLMARPASIYELCRMMNRVLFHEYGFRANHEDFENPANSLLSEVIRTRKGIPLTLGILYLLVAQRVGLDFEPICLPGRFMVAHFGTAEPVYVDAFESGRLRSPAEVESFLLNNELPLDPADLAPAPVGEVLLRFCRNLAHHYEGQGDEERAHLFAGLALEIAETYRRSTS